MAAVYFPQAVEILGERVVRDLKDIHQHVDILDVFRRPQDVAAHLPDILALRPGCVWLQTGIRLAPRAAGPWGCLRLLSMPGAACLSAFGACLPASVAQAPGGG